jgi:hypothetical protein
LSENKNVLLWLWRTGRESPTPVVPMNLRLHHRQYMATVVLKVVDGRIDPDDAK